MDLKMYLLKHHEGVREFARRSGVSPGTISRIATGKRFLPTLATMTAISKATKKEVGIADFITAAERKNARAK